MAVSKQIVLNALSTFKGLQDAANDEKFVAKDGDKVLSTNDYTTAEKTKLEGVAAGAQVNVIESITVDGTALTVTNNAVNIDLSGKVDKVTGKQLSTEDFTTELKDKLDAITDENITAAEVQAIFTNA